jgi:hypothetical protein
MNCPALASQPMATYLGRLSHDIDDVIADLEIIFEDNFLSLYVSLGCHTADNL